MIHLFIIFVIFINNENWGLKIKVLKFLGIHPIHIVLFTHLVFDRKGSLSHNCRCNLCIQVFQHRHLQQQHHIFRMTLDRIESSRMIHLRILTRDWYFEPKSKRNWMVRILGHLRIACICLHVTTSPSMTFWAISDTLPYIIFINDGIMIVK